MRKRYKDELDEFDEFEIRKVQSLLDNFKYFKKIGKGDVFFEEYNKLTSKQKELYELLEEQKIKQKRNMVYLFIMSAIFSIILMMIVNPYNLRHSDGGEYILLLIGWFVYFYFWGLIISYLLVGVIAYMFFG